MKQLVFSAARRDGQDTVTAALAHLAAEYHIVLADADGRSQSGLMLAPVTEETHDFTGGSWH